jgi:phosphatidylglycerophosphate synthase
MHKLYEEYKTSLKDISVEEMVDLFFFRPIAFLMVKLFYRFPITPNQVSVLSMAAGIVSGFFYAMGDKKSFLYAGLFYALSHLLDCCDGMIARMKKTGTPIGRIIDGWADYTTSTAVYVGLLIGLSQGSFQLPVSSPLLLMIPASFSLLVHCIIVDRYRYEFMAHGLGKTNTLREDLELFSAELKKLRKIKGKYLEKILIISYLGYTKLQLKKSVKKRQYPQDKYYKSNKPLLHLWNWIGLSTHISVMILATFLYDPMIFFYYVIVLANGWMLIVIILQVRTNKKIAVKE